MIPPDVPVGRDRRGPVVAVLCFVAAALTFAGTFLPLFTSTIRLGFPNSVLAITVTGWELQAKANGQADEVPSGAVPANGVPLIVAAALLLAASVVVRLTTPGPNGFGIGRFGALLTVAGAAFLAGIVGMVGMQELSWLDRFRPTGVTATVPDLGVNQTVAVGFWLLVVATLVAVVAGLLAWRPARSREPAWPSAWQRDEPETPQFGIPVVVRLPDEPHDDPEGQR